MGGEVSKVNVKSNRTPSNFLHRSLHDMRKGRHFSRPTKQSTPSKKELLSYEVIEDAEILEGSLEKGEYVNMDMKKFQAQHDQERVAKIIEAIVQEDDKEGDHGYVEDEDDDNNNNKDDQRMIKRHVEEDGDVFPGSPSFRVYFLNNNNVEDKKNNEAIIGNKDVIKDRTPIATTNRLTTPAATIPSPKVGNKEKKETKRKSFRSVLPKNLLNVRSCCSAAHSRPDRSTYLHPGKAPA